MGCGDETEIQLGQCLFSYMKSLVLRSVDDSEDFLIYFADFL